VIENTALEAVARLQHFSRKQLHPSKMDEARLAACLRDADVRTPNIERIAFDWVSRPMAGERDGAVRSASHRAGARVRGASHARAAAWLARRRRWAKTR